MYEKQLSLKEMRHERQAFMERMYEHTDAFKKSLHEKKEQDNENVEIETTLGSGRCPKMPLVQKFMPQ